MKKINNNLFLINAILISGVIIFILICFTIINSPDKLIYDERYFIVNLEKLFKSGFTINNLLYYKNQAPGPLFQIIYFFIFRIINLKYSIIYIRLFNFLFFNLGIYFFLRIFHTPYCKLFWVKYFSIFSIPFIYPIFGIGLTESTSLFFISLSIFSFFRKKNTINYLILIIYSIALSLALIGRQTFLALVPFLILYILFSNFSSKKKVIFCLSTIVAITPLCFLIYFWKGITPPDQSFVSGGTIFSYSFKNGLLGIGYSAISFFILNATILSNYFKPKPLASSIIIAIILEFIVKLEFIPFGTIFNKYSNFNNWIQYLFPILIISIAILYIYILFKLVLKSNKHYSYNNVFIILFNFAMTLTTFKVTHQFSSRYIAQFSFLHLNNDYDQENNINYFAIFLILIFGAMFGLYTLNSYYSL